jgi:GTP cyclohydrolase II
MLNNNNNKKESKNNYNFDVSIDLYCRRKINDNLYEQIATQLRKTHAANTVGKIIDINIKHKRISFRSPLPSRIRLESHIRFILSSDICKIIHETKRALRISQIELSIAIFYKTYTCGFHLSQESISLAKKNHVLITFSCYPCCS